MQIVNWDISLYQYRCQEVHKKIVFESKGDWWCSFPGSCFHPGTQSLCVYRNNNPYLSFTEPCCSPSVHALSQTSSICSSPFKQSPLCLSQLIGCPSQSLAWNRRWGGLLCSQPHSYVPDITVYGLTGIICRVLDTFYIFDLSSVDNPLLFWKLSCLAILVLSYWCSLMDYHHYHCFNKVRHPFTYLASQIIFKVLFQFAGWFKTLYSRTPLGSGVVYESKM